MFDPIVVNSNALSFTMKEAKSVCVEKNSETSPISRCMNGCILGSDRLSVSFAIELSLQAVTDESTTEDTPRPSSTNAKRTIVTKASTDTLNSSNTANEPITSTSSRKRQAVVASRSTQTSTLVTQMSATFR